MFLSGKRVLVFVLAALVVVSAAFAQNQAPQREMTIEESYLRESTVMMIIRETARSDTREQKMIALEWIGEEISGGNTNPEITQTLRFLSMEGTNIQARENNRLVNNFTEVRRGAAKLLGQIGTEEAVVALIDICRFENEPMVLQEAIKSLGDIGLNNETNDTVRYIVHKVGQIDRTNPNSLVAIATIEALEKIAVNYNGLSSADAINLLRRISENTRYEPIVRERARQAFATLRSLGR